LALLQRMSGSTTGWRIIPSFWPGLRHVKYSFSSVEVSVTRLSLSRASSANFFMDDTQAPIRQVPFNG
jgi:hypothetical protein